MSEYELMKKVQREVGPLLCQLTVGRPAAAALRALLAALVANESNAEREATRFEPGVFSRICLAALGKKEFQDPSLSRPIEQQEWLREGDVAIDRYRTPGESYALTALKQWKKLATSWGYTQLMGWHALEWHVPLEEFMVTEHHFRYAIRLLDHGMAKYHLYHEADAGGLLRFWNTGTVHRPTYDPQYVPRGLERLRIYQQLEQGE